MNTKCISYLLCEDFSTINRYKCLLEDTVEYIYKSPKGDRARCSLPCSHERGNLQSPHKSQASSLRISWPHSICLAWDVVVHLHLEWHRAFTVLVPFNHMWFNLYDIRQCLDPTVSLGKKEKKCSCCYFYPSVPKAIDYIRGQNFLSPPLSQTHKYERLFFFFF